MAELSSAPVLSTPAEHTFIEDPTDPSLVAAAQSRSAGTDDEKHHVYEIARTARHIHRQKWRRIALQFPDAMLPDGPWVVRALAGELAGLATTGGEEEGVVADEDDEALQNGRAEPAQGTSGGYDPEPAPTNPLETEIKRDTTTTTSTTSSTAHETHKDGLPPPRLYILADTSYSACCVDEIAAEHADADAVVHYGRACLSPTSRVPVLHVFTRQKLDYDDVVGAFEREFPLPPKEEAGEGGSVDKVVVIIMADVMFQEHVQPVCEMLRRRGHVGVRATEIVHDPAAPIPNRRVVTSNTTDDSGTTTTPSQEEPLRDHHLFHISTPPAALLMTLSSRLSSLRIYPTPSSPYSAVTSEIPDPSMTPRLLQRRYALVLRLATASVIGILVNTLSVRNYMDTISRLKAQIAAAGKKSYTIVVGKLNPAKLANFAEIDGWVVVGCWESGLVEQDGMWKPVITPFELGLALQGDDKRVWTGEWWGGIEGVDDVEVDAQDDVRNGGDGDDGVDAPGDDLDPGDISDEESAPPEFDLRTGKLVSNSRPMRATTKQNLAVRSAAAAAAAKSTPTDTDAAADGRQSQQNPPSTAVAKRSPAGYQIAAINGIASPGAEFLRSQRTWQGLGTDFDADADGEDGVVGEESTVVEEGRSGIARGYTVGGDQSRS